jgi:hypothetical protein
MAIFVFNPTLTMHQAYRSSSPSPAKAVMPNATKRTARRQVKAKHPAEEAGTGKVEIKHFGFPLFGMNNGASGH